MRIPVFIRLPGDAEAAAFPASPLTRLAGLAGALRRWWRTQVTLDELGGLDDATLRDLGLDRRTLRHDLARAAWDDGSRMPGWTRGSRRG